jgi:hypothetical protein
MARDPKARFILHAERQGEQAFKSFEQDLAKIAKRAALVGAALAGAMAAGIAAVTKASFASQDRLAKWSDTVGDSMQNIEAFRRQGQLAGLELEKMDQTLFKASRRLAEFNQTGAGPAGRWLQRLQLDTAELARLQPTELVQRYAEAIRGLDTRGEQLAATMALMGDESGDLLRVVDQGREAFEAQRAEVERYGLALSRVDAAKIEAANDAIFNIRERTKGLGNLIAAETAPLITHLAQGFLNASADADTMRSVISRAMDVAIAGAGHAADAFHGWRLIIAELNIAMLALEERFQVFSRMHEVGAQGEQQLIDLARQHGLEIQTIAEKFDLQAESIEDARAAAQRHRDELIAGGPPSERMAAAWERVKEEAQAAAEAVAAAVRTPPEFSGDAGATEAEQARADAEAARLREQLERNLEQVRTFTLSREEVELEAHARRLEVLRNAFEQELIDKERFDELSILVAQRTQDTLTEIAKAGWTERQKFAEMSAKAQTEAVLDSLIQMSQGVATHNKAMFRVNQAAALARAVVNVAEGVTKALSAYPPPLSFLMAAAQAAAGAAQISAIRSAQFGSGTTPSVAGSVPTHEGHPLTAPQTQPAPQRAPTVLQITIQGGVADRQTGVEIAEILRDLIDNSDVEIIGEGSSQAAKIRRAF